MSTIILVRHAHAEPRGSKDEFARNLDEEGRRQTQELRSKLRGRGLSPHLGLFSPAKRTKQTLDLVVGDDIPKIEVPSLIYIGGGNFSIAEQIIGKVGEEAPFSQWLSQPGGYVFRQYAQMVNHAIVQATNAVPLTEHILAATILIVGHSLTMNAVALGVLGKEHPLILGPCPGYGRGFVITGKEVTAI